MIALMFVYRIIIGQTIDKNKTLTHIQFPSRHDTQEDQLAPLQLYENTSVKTSV